MLRVCNISSGSEGNCTFVEVNQNTRILIDAGISASRIVEGLKLINIAPEQIDAIIISHEHSDHIKGIDVFSNKFKTPVYAHKKQWDALDKKLKRVTPENKHVFFDEDFYINDALVKSVEVSHDAKHTRAYTIKNKISAFSIITDLGVYDEGVVNLAKNSTLVYVESNHDEDLLRQNPKYASFLKSRILSRRGHLSNNQCARLIEKLAHTGTKQFVLSHLSKENNTPNLAYDTVCEYLSSKDIIEGKHIKIDVAKPSIGNIFVLK